MAGTASSTRGETAFRSLRGDILAGRLQPGARLRFADLCSRYDVSMGVLREALSRLVGQGLVQLEPQQGYRVVPLSVEDLSELTAARVQIELLVLRDAIAHGDLAWESQLTAQHHTLARTVQIDPSDPARVTQAWVDAHARFHAAVLEGCRNSRMRTIANDLRASAELYRQWSHPLGHDHNRDIAAEHRDLLEAALARDVEAATAILGAHIEHTSNVLLDHAATEG